MTNRADVGRTPTETTTRPAAQPWGRPQDEPSDFQGPIIDPTTPPRHLSFRGAPATVAILVFITALELLLTADDALGLFSPPLRLNATDYFAYLPMGTLIALSGGSLLFLGQTVTSIFLHGSLIHVAFNSAVLAILGPPAERLVRWPGFLLLFVVAGVTGALGHFGWEYLSASAGSEDAVYRLTTPLVGASGAICGLLGFDLRRRALALKRIPRRRRWISPARWLWRASMAFLAINLIVALSDSYISGAAHLGGFAAGLLLAPWLLRGRPLLDEPLGKA